jgi:hypothetical protein
MGHVFLHTSAFTPSLATANTPLRSLIPGEAPVLGCLDNGVGFHLPLPVGRSKFKENNSFFAKDRKATGSHVAQHRLKVGGLDRANIALLHSRTTPKSSGCGSSSSSTHSSPPCRCGTPWGQTNGSLLPMSTSHEAPMLKYLLLFSSRSSARHLCSSISHILFRNFLQSFNLTTKLCLAPPPQDYASVQSG